MKIINPNDVILDDSRTPVNPADIEFDAPPQVAAPKNPPVTGYGIVAPGFAAPPAVPTPPLDWKRPGNAVLPAGKQFMQDTIDVVAPEPDPIAAIRADQKQRMEAIKPVVSGMKFIPGMAKQTNLSAGYTPDEVTQINGELDAEQKAITALKGNLRTQAEVDVFNGRVNAFNTKLTQAKDMASKVVPVFEPPQQNITSGIESPPVASARLLYDPSGIQMVNDIKGLMKNSPEKEQAITAVAQQFGINHEEAARNYDELTRQINPDRANTLRENIGQTVEYAMMAAIPAQLIITPFKLLAGIGTFMGAAEAWNAFVSKATGQKYQFQAGKGTKDLLPADVNEGTKFAADALDFIGQAALGGWIGKAAGNAFRLLTPKERGLVTLDVKQMMGGGMSEGQSIRQAMKKMTPEGRADFLKEQIARRGTGEPTPATEPPSPMPEPPIAPMAATEPGAGSTFTAEETNLAPGQTPSETAPIPPAPPLAPVAAPEGEIVPPVASGEVVEAPGAVAEPKLSETATDKYVPTYDAPTENIMESTPMQDKNLWDDMWGHIDTVQQETGVQIIEKKQELDSVKKKKDPESKARRIQLENEINELNSHAPILNEEYDNRIQDYQDRVEQEARTEAQKRGVSSEVMDDFVGAFMEQASTERPYIEDNYNKTKRQIFDEVVQDYLPKRTIVDPADVIMDETPVTEKGVIPNGQEGQTQAETGLLNATPGAVATPPPINPFTIIVPLVDNAINDRAKSKIFIAEGAKAVPGIRLGDAEEAGRMAYLTGKGEVTQEEFNQWVETAKSENRIVKPPAPSQQPPVTETKAPEVPAGETLPAPEPSPSLPPGIDATTDAFVRKTVQAKGSLDAAKAVYSGKSAVDEYGRKVAEEVWGTKASEAPAKQPWEMTKKEYAASGNELPEVYHRNGIVSALSKGRPVPASVLADYPDLKPAAPSQATEAAPDGELKVGDLVKWNGDTSGRIDRVTGVVTAPFGGGLEYMTEETNPPEGKTPRRGKQFWDKTGEYAEDHPNTTKGIVKIFDSSVSAPVEVPDYPALYDEAQDLMRKLPSNIGKAKQEGKLSKPQQEKLARLDEIEKIMPSTSPEWKAQSERGRANWEKENAARIQKISDAETAKMRDKGYEIGDKVSFYVPPLFPGAPETRYEGTVRQNKSGQVIVKARNMANPKAGVKNLDLFRNPWSKAEEAKPTETVPPEPAASSVFIRALSATEQKSVSLRNRAMRDMPEKEGHEAAYKPYGEQGPGIYYVPKKGAETVNTVSDPTSKTVLDPRISKLRSTAEGMQKQINEKRNPAIGQMNVTARRSNISAGMADEADSMERTQKILKGMADDIEAGTLPDVLANINSKALVDDIRRRAKWKNPMPDIRTNEVREMRNNIQGMKGAASVGRSIADLLRREHENMVEIHGLEEVKALEELIALAEKKDPRRGASKWVKDGVKDAKRFYTAGFKNAEEVKAAAAALEKYITPESPEVRKKRELDKAKHDLIGADIAGFFPTPKPVVSRLIEKADIRPGMKVLEPSAGMGDIADALVEKAGKENVDTAEISSSLKRYLELKGYTPKPDFLEMTGQYDRIVMNPPFEKFQDIDHVRKAYDMLKPGGKLVAIMGEGSFFRTDKKAQEFRDWLDETGGTNEKLESGAFTGKEAFRQTGVASRIVEIEKPKQPTENRTKPEIVKEYISALDTMESRRKARDYSDWNKLNEQTNALLSEAYGQGFDLQEAAKNEAPSRDIKDIKKDIADTEKRLDALRKGIKIPGVDEGATRANTTTYNANAGNLAKMRDAYRDELKRAEEKEQAPAAEKSLPEGVSPIEVKRMEDEVSRIRNKVSSLETRMESLNKASEGIPGSFVTGRSNYPKSLANMREGMNNKLSDNFSELQKERENLKYKENLLNSYRAGEVHPNGQPRANAPSREASKKAEATWSDFIRATVKPGDRVTFTQNPIPEGNEVSRVNKKTVTFKGGTAWDHIEILPWKDGKPLTQKESIAEFRAWREKQVQPEPVSKKPVASKATGIDRDPTWKPKFHKSTGDIILHPKAITPEVMPATWAIEGTRVGKYYDQLGMRGDKSDTTVGAYGILETKSGKTNYDSVHADWTQRYQEATGMPVTDKDFDSVYEQAKQEITQYQDGRIFRDTTGKFHRSDTQQFTPEELKNKQEDWRDGLRKEGFTDEDISDLESRTATEDDIRYAIRKAKADADEEIGNLYPDEADEAIREVDKEDKVAPVAPIPKSAKNPDATIGLFDLTDSATGETIPAGTPHYILNDGRIFSEDSYSKLIDVGAQENLFSHGEVKAEKTGKELWKMNPDEFARNVKHTVSEDGKTVTVELPDGKTLSFDRTPGVDIYNHAHELIVEEAAKANKPIPDHVLRSHPQLFAKYGKKPSESAPVEDKQASMLNGEQGITGQHDMFAEKPANIPMPNKIKPIRFEAGKTLTKEQRKEVLRNISDAYRVNGVEKREVVIQTHGGTEDEVVYRYPYTPSAFEKSDITGKMVRYYIFLPDGKKAHPSELFPELTEAQIQRELDRQRYEEEKAKKDEAYEVDAKMSRVAPPSDNQMQEANKAYIKTGRHSSYSFFAKDKEGNLVRVDGSDAKDIAFYKAREFRPTAPANGLREEEVEEYKRKAMKDFPPPAFKDANNPMGLEQKPEAPATPESHFDGLKRSLVNSTSENHVVIYNRQYVDMGYVEDPKEQFKMAAMRVYDNLGTGKDATDTGYIRTPQGEFFKVTRANKTAVKVSPDEILGTAKEKPETPTAKGEAGTISPATAKTLLSLPGEQRRYPSGDHLSSLRQQIIAELTGEKVPKSKADAMAVESALKKASGIEHGTFQEYLNWLKGIAESDSPAFMARPALPGDRIPGAEVMRAVDAVASKFNVSVKVVPTAADLPEGIRDAAMRRQAGGYVVLGIYHGGKVYIVAEHMRSRMEAQKVFIHEAVGHYGLRKVMGKDFEDFLDFIVNDTKYGTEINAFAEKNGIDDPRVSADEWFAQQSETARPSLWNRFMMAVKAFLARLGVKWEFSKTELTELLRKAREAAVKGGPVKGGGTRYQVEAWHGSPHQVDKFSSDKIGSGEGAQAFGWGLYFTDKKEIGKIYAESTAEQQKTILIDGEDVPSELKYEAKFLANRLYADLHDYVKPNYRARAISTLESEISFSKLKGYTNSIKEKEKLLKLIKASKGIEINRSRNLYKVTLHKGKDPSEYNYLEWEKKVTDTQKDLIRKQLIKEPSANKDVENLFTKFNPQPDINEQLGIDIHGKELYDLLENKLGSDKEASLFLLRAGIDGIKYPAGTLSGVKSDAYNYVVFDENAVTIDEATRFATRPASQGIELPEETRMQWFQRMVQDKLNRLEQVQGKTPVISEATDAYMKSELFIGKATERVKEFDKEIVSGKDSFLSKLTDSGFTISELDMLLYAEHAKERNAYIATINKKLPEAGSGMSDDDANAIIDAADPALVQFAKEFRNKVTRAALQLRLDEGLITQETYDTLDSFYQNYVPLKGKAGKESYRRIGKGFSVTGKDIIRARGRSSMADSPVTQAIMDMDDAIVRAEKNKVMLALRQLVLDNPGEFWHVEKLQYLPKYDKDGNIEYMDPRYKYDPEAIEVKVEGKTEYVMIQDKALVEGLKNMGAGQGIKILSTVNNYLRAVNTIYSPEFIITNFERDIQTAIINIGGEKSAKIARKMVKDVPAAMQGIYRNVRDKKPNAWADLYEEFKETGGRIGWMDMDSIEQRSNKLEKQVRDFKNPNGLRQTVKAVGEYMDNMNEAVESGVRLSAYKQLRDAGVSKEKAAQYAKNLTVNFNKKGQWGTILNILYLFSNASIQGSARMLGALKKPRVQAIVGSILTSSVLMGLLNRWRDEDSWDQVPGYTKDTNWLVPLTDGKYIAFRVPYGYNIFHVLGNVTEETIFGNLSLPEAAGRVMNGMLNAFNPLGGASLFQMLSPTIIDPLAMAVENKNFMGTQLHPEQAPYQPYAPASSLFTKGNREGSVFFSQWLNRITGGNETLSGKVDIYPAYFDLILDTIGGGVSRSTADLIQSGVTLAKGDIPDLNHIPIARQFVKTPSQSTAKSVVYDMAKEAERHIFSENQMARFYYSLRLAEENGSMSREQIRKVRRGFEKSQKTAIKSRGGYSPLQQPTSEPEPEPVKHRPMTLQDMIR